jgi:ribonuclease P protein component
VTSTVSLRKNHEFKRAYNKGKSSASQFVAIYCLQNGSSLNRLGITASAKIGGAVQRNRVRRRLKEIYRINESGMVLGYDIVIVARKRSVDSNYQELESSVLSLFRKLSIL